MSKKITVKTKDGETEVTLVTTGAGTRAPKVSSGDLNFDKFVSEGLQTVFKPKK